MLCRDSPGQVGLHQVMVLLPQSVQADRVWQPGYSNPYSSQAIRMWQALWCNASACLTDEHLQTGRHITANFLGCCIDT